MSLSQEQANRYLIRSSWLLLISHSAGWLVSMTLWMLHLLSDRVQAALTNWLSWEAAVLTAGNVLLLAYTKRDVDT